MASAGLRMPGRRFPPGGEMGREHRRLARKLHRKAARPFQTHYWIENSITTQIFSAHNGRWLAGVFDDAAERVQLVDGVEVISHQPRMTMAVEDLDEEPVRGRLVSVFADQSTAPNTFIQYSIREVEPDASHTGVEVWLQLVTAPGPTSPPFEGAIP